jgi:hypothetical protein
MRGSMNVKFYGNNCRVFVSFMKITTVIFHTYLTLLRYHEKSYVNSTMGSI